MSDRPNLSAIIRRASKKAMERRVEGFLPCFADRLAITLAEMPLRETETALREWVAAGTAKASDPIRMRGEVARSWLSEAA